MHPIRSEVVYIAQGQYGTYRVVDMAYNGFVGFGFVGWFVGFGVVCRVLVCRVVCRVRWFVGFDPDRCYSK